jgi:predicted nucleotide-binding protein
VRHFSRKVDRVQAETDHARTGFVPSRARRIEAEGDDFFFEKERQSEYYSNTTVRWPMKPRLFVGSSSEKRLYALALQKQLKSSAEVTVWDQGFFQINIGYLASLIDGLQESDFAAFVFAPEDILEIREEKLESIRDNVLFEFGLALGKLGKDRAFFLVPEVQDKLRLPSDLMGISTVTFDSNQTNFEAALGPAVFSILQAIARFGVRQERLGQPQIETIKNPKVLCACSPWYFKTSFQKDVELIRKETKNLSARISESNNINSRQLTEILLEDKFDIIHIAAYVHPRTGDVCFGDLTSEGGPPNDDSADAIPAVAFSRLIELAKAKLVVLATCDSLILAAKLAKIANMIAATDFISINDILQWELGLYKCLSKGISLSNAFETASTLSKAPMLLLLKKDVAFIG